MLLQKSLYIVEFLWIVRKLHGIAEKYILQTSLYGYRTLPSSLSMQANVI